MSDEDLQVWRTGVERDPVLYAEMGAMIARLDAMAAENQRLREGITQMRNAALRWDHTRPGEGTAPDDPTDTWILTAMERALLKVERAALGGTEPST